MQIDEYTFLREYVTRMIDVTEAEWKAYRDALTRRFLKKGEFLVREGQVCDHVSFINQGSLRSYRYVNNQEVSKHFFFDHEYASEYCSFLTRTPSTLNIKALEDTELLELNYGRVQTLYENYPVWQKFGRLMAERLFIMLAERVQELLYLGPEELYLKILEQRPHIIGRVPQHHIASYLGIQPESLSRIKKRMMEVKKY